MKAQRLRRDRTSQEAHHLGGPAQQVGEGHIQQPVQQVLESDGEQRDGRRPIFCAQAQEEGDGQPVGRISQQGHNAAAGAVSHHDRFERMHQDIGGHVVQKLIGKLGNDAGQESVPWPRTFQRDRQQRTPPSDMRAPPEYVQGEAVGTRPQAPAAG